MAPSTPKNQRKQLSNAEKQEIIEDSLKSGYISCKTTYSKVTYSSHLLNLLNCFLD